MTARWNLALNYKRMSKRMIVKVQVPLVASDPDAGVLVYNKDRSVMSELPLRSERERDELLDMLGDEPKGYFYAKFDGKGLILIGKAPAIMYLTKRKLHFIGRTA